MCAFLKAGKCIEASNYRVTLDLRSKEGGQIQHRQPLAGSMGVAMATSCVAGQAFSQHSLPIPLALGESRVPLDTRPHPAILTPCSHLPHWPRKLQGRARKDQRPRPQVLERKGLNYLLLVHTGGFMRRPLGGVLPVS